jgi:hypothetical protein
MNQTNPTADRGADLAEKYGLDLHTPQVHVQYDKLVHTLEGFDWVAQPAKVFSRCRETGTTALAAAQRWESRNYVVITKVTRDPVS